MVKYSVIVLKTFYSNNSCNTYLIVVFVFDHHKLDGEFFVLFQTVESKIEITFNSNQLNLPDDQKVACVELQVARNLIAESVFRKRIQSGGRIVQLKFHAHGLEVVDVLGIEKICA